MTTPNEIGAALPGVARAIYDSIFDLPIVSPHGHCDPSWWADNAPFPNPAALLIQPDHYVFRMLYSQGVPLADLGIGPGGEDRDPRAVFRLFAQHWDAFLGTPSRQWIEFTLRRTLAAETPLTPGSADALYDEVAAKLTEPAFQPRALFDRFGIEVLATTDAATDPLTHHAAIAGSGWPGRVIPTFRPDDLLNPQRPNHPGAIARLAEMTGRDVARFPDFLEALRLRRAAFIATGATATDHDVPDLGTRWLDRDVIEDLHAKALAGTLSRGESKAYYGHMLVEMAQMSVEDGLVMQIHAGSRRNTNAPSWRATAPTWGPISPARLIGWVA